MSLNYINRSNDEEIIDIMRSILSEGNMKVETINEAILVKLMELRGTPIKYIYSLREINKDYEQWLEQKNDKNKEQQRKIEPPSDEEIEEYVKSTGYYGHCTHEYHEGIEQGAKWVRDKIQGGNNEQQ